jgi:2',3'-cyclic-nucleotide 2'-phosphodiesterase (5'-nucleotidase family)
VPSVVLERGGQRIGILGVTVPMATPQKVDAALWDNLFAPPIETAKRLAAELRPRCELLIALTHIGIAQDRKLAEAIPELNLIVGGHTHVVLETPEMVNTVPMVQAGSHARYLGHVIFDDGVVTGALHSL